MTAYGGFVNINGGHGSQLVNDGVMDPTHGQTAHVGAIRTNRIGPGEKAAATGRTQNEVSPVARSG
jgi:hypothetical protein